MAGITHEWNGTVLTITSDSGSSSCDLKGATGDTGIRGPQGPKGEKGNGIDSVNGKIGDVVLTYEDVGALPDTYIPPVTKVNSKTGEVTLTYEDVGALPNTYVAPVTSVNTKTGAVQLTYSDVGAAAANHTHTAADVGALAAGGTAADSSKLGGKSANEYALKTDTAPDSSKLGGKAPEYYIQPHNLFDNSNFVDPVMQAEFNGMHGNGQYVIDRWLHLYNLGSSEKVYGGIALTGADFYMAQKVGEDVSGKTLTFAVCLADGTVVCGTENVGDLSSTIVFAQHEDLYLMLYNGYFSIRIATGTYTIKRAALYEGSYTADTLPPYVPKGYAAELAECLRYYYRPDGYCIGIAHPYTTTDAYITIFTPIKMRKVSAIVFSNLRIAKNDYMDDGTPSIESISNIKVNSNNITFFAHITGELALGKEYSIYTVGSVEIISDL